MEMKELYKGSVIIVVLVLFAVMFVPMFSVSSNSTTLDVLIIDGQSNAAYQNTDESVDLELINEELGAPKSDLMYYGSDSGVVEYNDNPSTLSLRPMYSEGSYVVGGLIAPFGYYISEKTDRNILVLCVGISGQSITNLVPGSTGGEWKISIIQSALSKIQGYDTVNMLGWVWLQGETDKSMDVDTYKAYFADLKAYYDSIGCKTCYIVEMSSKRGGNAEIAQRQLIAQYPSVVSGIDTEGWDGTSYVQDYGSKLHYTQEGRIVIAETISGEMQVTPMGEWMSLNSMLSIVPVIIISGIIIGIVALFRMKYT